MPVDVFGSVHAETGAVEVSVDVVARGTQGSEWMQLRMRVEPDAEEGHRWLCAPIGVYRGQPAACLP